MSPRLKWCLATAFALLTLAWLIGVGVSLRGSWIAVGSANSPGNGDAADMNASGDSARVSEGAAAAPTWTSPQRSGTSSAPYRVTFNGIPIEEVERGETYSYVGTGIAVDPSLISRLESLAYPGDIGSFERLISNIGAIVELGCLRDFDYYFVLAEAGNSGFYVYFTNDEQTPIRELLGDRYSPNAQRQFDADGYRRAFHVGISGTESCMGTLGSVRP